MTNPNPRPKTVPDPFNPGTQVRESLAEVQPFDRLRHAVQEHMSAPTDPTALEAAREAFATNVATTMKETP